ncbi:hypothetical protein K438DRAFT_2058405 [Mycena galopus ATCC 62051]|nr:hypothetical protein K438DRAFT_2058405 [Mycena galopus ATCC 62051]
MECDIFWNIQQTKWFATFIWVPHLLTLTTTPNFVHLEISTQLTWMPEREKHSPVPPVPLRTPVARRLAQAKYLKNHKEEEAEKSRVRIARYRASIKADPEHVQEQKDREKCANKAYREKNRHLLAFKKQEKRKEANAQKGTKQGYQVEEKKDYALEYALWTHRRQDELQQRVSDTLWRDKDGPKPLPFTLFSARFRITASTPLGGSLFFPPWSNPERDTKKVKHPACLQKYSSWGGGATKFSWEACLPVWHACCDAGEHAHPSSPTIPVCLEPPRTPKTQAHCTTAAHTPCTPTTATLASPSTVSTLSATGTTFSFSVHRFAHANPPPHPLDQEGCERKFILVVDHLPPLPLHCGPRTLPPALYPPLNATQTYVVRGSGTIHTSLDDALNIAAARSQATLCATGNAWVATHVAAGHTLEDARALTLVPPVPPMLPPMPPPEVEPETTGMNIDEPTGRENDEGSQDGRLLDNGSSDEDEGPDAEGEELSAVLEGVASLGVDRE